MLRTLDDKRIETIVIVERRLEDFVQMKAESLFSNVLDDLKLETILSALKTKMQLQKDAVIEWFTEDAKVKKAYLEGVYLRSVVLRMQIQSFWNDGRADVNIEEKDFFDAILRLAKESQQYIKPVMTSPYGYPCDVNKWVVQAVYMQTVWESKTIYNPVIESHLKKRRLDENGKCEKLSLPNIDLEFSDVESLFQ